jgi:hypothetical protein
MSRVFRRGNGAGWMVAGRALIAGAPSSDRFLGPPRNTALAITCGKKGRTHMESKVNWETSMDTALSRARAEGKSILLDFFNPG